MAEKTFKIGDRVQICGGAWPDGAQGTISAFALGGPPKMAKVGFDKPVTREGHDCSYSWYTWEQMQRLQPKKCVFCDSKYGLDEAQDEKGQTFVHCGWCWAHVLKGGFMPADVTVTIKDARAWLLGPERPGQEELS